jgi:superfamily II DNA or RNA helicase
LEIHDSISPAYIQFYKNNTYKGLIGLSATTKSNQRYEIEGVEYKKRDLLKQVAPICYSYTLNDSMKDDVSRQLDIYVIKHHLEKSLKTVKAGSKNKPFYQTERNAYDYWEGRFKRTLFEERADKDLQIKIVFAKLNKILYNLKSKEDAVKRLMTKLKGQTIIFGNSIEQLNKITPYTISSKNSTDKNKKILTDYDNGKIDTLGSFKMLKQGANLKGLDNCVLESFYSVEKDFIQRVGRLRKNGDKAGSVFIFVSQDTREVKWLDKMLGEDNKELNIIHCESVDKAVNLYRQKFMRNQ